MAQAASFGDGGCSVVCTHAPFASIARPMNRSAALSYLADSGSRSLPMALRHARLLVASQIKDTATGMRRVLRHAGAVLPSTWRRAGFG